MKMVLLLYWAPDTMELTDDVMMSLQEYGGLEARLATVLKTLFPTSTYTGITVQCCTCPPLMSCYRRLPQTTGNNSSSSINGNEVSS